MKIKIRILGLCAAFVLSFSCAFAETITFTSGKKVEAPIVERDESKVIVEVDGVKVPYFLNGIAQIGQEVIKHVSSDQVTVAQPAVPQVSDSSLEKSAPEVPVNGSPDQPEFSKTGSNRLNLDVKVEDNSRDFKDTDKEGKSLTSKGGFSKSPFNAKANNGTGLAGLAAVSGIIFLIVVILSLGMYVYISFCLYVIGQKTNQGPLWLAWVPIAQIILMFKIAGLSYWWLLVFLTSFIPIIGSLAVLALSGYLYYKIALARNKPGWMGILMFLPLVNLVVIGYLAFSD